MSMNASFFVQNAFLGVGLAMDAFSVSIANAIADPDMKKGRRCLIAGTFGVFQTAMPLIGWFFFHWLAVSFDLAEKLIPWIGFILLLFIGGKMVWEGLHPSEDAEKRPVGLLMLLGQGVATSIDALSVGVTMAEWDVSAALIGSVIIGAVTFAICLAGVLLGRQIGLRYAGRAGILGGLILIAIGVRLLLGAVL